MSKFDVKPESKKVEIDADKLELLLKRVDQLEAAQAEIKPTPASIDAIKRKHTLQETPEAREARRPEDAKLLAGIRASHAKTMHKVNRKYRDSGTVLYNDRGR